MHELVSRKKSATLVFLLIFVLAGAFVFRSIFAASVMPPPARMQGETTQSYRYAKMIANGSGIPSVDTLVMQPDGFNTSENSIFEEYIAGGIYRAIPAISDFDSFLNFFCSFFPLLTAIALYFWMMNSGFSFYESISGSTLYGVFLPALLRTRGESFYRETVALPFLIATLTFIDISRRKENVLKFSVPAALFLFLSLAAWKVTAFISLFLFLYLAFTRPGWKIVLPLVVAQIAAALFLTHMQHDNSIYSGTSIIAITSLLSAFYRKKYIPYLGVFVSLLATFFFSSSSTSHVSAVILAKLKFFFLHPSNPTLLSPDARLFWVSGYATPSLAQIILLFGVSIIIAAFAWRTFKKNTSGSLMFYFLPLSLAGYLFFDRLHVLLAVAIIPAIIAFSKKSKWLLPVIITIFGLQSMFAPKLAGLIQSAGLQFEDTSSLLTDSELDDLIVWSSEHRETTLSFWHISGLLSAYAQSPVVTHTFFENTQNREAIMQFAYNIYNSEDEMIQFMEASGARYLVYQADFIFDRSSQGLLYLSGNTEVPDGSLAIRLHYYPYSLERLIPVWQGASLRVFELDGQPQLLKRFPLWEARYAQFFDTDEAASISINLPVETGIFIADQGFLSEDPQKLSAALLLFSQNTDDVPADAAISLLQELLMKHLSGVYAVEYLEEDFIVYLDSWGPDPQLRFDLVRLLRDNGKFDRADYHMQILESMGRSNL